MENIPRKADLATDLATAIIQDIYDNALVEGDRYYTTEEVCRKFGVCTVTASNAMKILAEREVLVRLRRRGTFIGSKARQQEKAIEKHIIVLSMPAPGYGPMPAFFSLPNMLSSVMDNAHIQTHVLPRGKDLLFLNDLKARESRPEGIVTGFRLQETLEVLESLDVPVVVMGTLDPGMPDLPTIDIDFYKAGYLLAEQMINKGHQNLLVQLCGDSGADHRFGDGAADAMSDADLSRGSLKFRNIPENINNFEAILENILTQKNHPTAIITREQYLADIVAEVAKNNGLKLGKDVDIVWTSNSWREEIKTPFFHIQPKLSMKEVAELVAGMLEDQYAGKPLKERNIFIPVELCPPSH